MSSSKKTARTCAWPRCGVRVNDLDFLPIVGENTGRIYSCAKHRDRIALTKAVVGTGVLAAFHEGLDRAAPGMRERIGAVGTTLFDLFNAARDQRATTKTE